MSNIIIIKNGQSAPSPENLQRGEIGFDRSNKKLYIGVSEQEVFCFNQDMVVDYKDIEFDVNWLIKDNAPYVGYAIVDITYLA